MTKSVDKKKKSKKTIAKKKKKVTRMKDPAKCA